MPTVVVEFGKDLLKQEDSEIPVLCIYNDHGPTSQSVLEVLLDMGQKS